MEDNLKKILDIFEDLKGQHVLISESKVARLVCIGDDGSDYYWVTWNGRSTVLSWWTCVGSVIPLKGYLRDQDYRRIVRLSELNDWDQFLKERPEDMEKLKKELLNNVAKGHKYLVEPCFDLN